MTLLVQVQREPAFQLIGYWRSRTEGKKVTVSPKIVPKPLLTNELSLSSNKARNAHLASDSLHTWSVPPIHRNGNLPSPERNTFKILCLLEPANISR